VESNPGFYLDSRLADNVHPNLSACNAPARFLTARPVRGLRKNPKAENCRNSNSFLGHFILLRNPEPRNLEQTGRFLLLPSLILLQLTPIDSN
jgi:hypothetical protein